MDYGLCTIMYVSRIYLYGVRDTSGTLPDLSGSILDQNWKVQQLSKSDVSNGVGDQFESPQDAEWFLTVLKHIWKILKIEKCKLSFIHASTCTCLHASSALQPAGPRLRSHAAACSHAAAGCGTIPRQQHGCKQLHGCAGTALLAAKRGRPLACRHMHVYAC